MDLKDVERYKNEVVPMLEQKLLEDIPSETKVDIYRVYKDILRTLAPHDFISYNKFLELEEDHNNTYKAFYHHRKDHLKEIFETMNDMEMYDKYDMVLLSTPPRVGKEQPLYSKVLGANGWINMGDIKVGEKIIGVNGSVIKVTDIFPQGVKPVYRITFEDGSHADCGLEHLWRVQSEDDLCERAYHISTTKDMIDALPHTRLCIPLVRPIQFPNKITDDETHPRDLGIQIRKGLLDHIPEKYLFSSIHNRIMLFRGIFGEEFKISIKDEEYVYSIPNETLLDNMVDLIRSLGGIAGKRGENGELVLWFTYCRPHKFIESIEYVGEHECQCIMVDCRKHLYLTDGYSVTHNTTIGIRFLSWIIGRKPLGTQLATSYSDSITSSFYIGTMEIIESEAYKEVFPTCPLVNQNAKRQEIWLQQMRRYPSIGFVSIGGSMTGRAEASDYLFADDLVSGIEEAMSPTRLDKLWQLYTVNCKQRKKDGAKEIHIATRWSVHDPITKLANSNEDNPRCKIISLPCYDEDGESTFAFNGGFSTKYYKDLESTMDEASFNALYKCEPVEREGLLYHKEDLMYYYELPKEKPDTIVAVCDSKNMGKDFVSSPIGYVYGDFVYIEDVVFNNGLPEITRPLVVNKWVEHKVVRGDVELNNGGNYYAEGLDNGIKDKGGKTSIRIFYSGNNKNVKIVTYSDYVVKTFIFKDPSTYSPNSEYALFMKSLLTWTQTGNNKHDDAVDSIAMLAQLVQDLSGTSIKILNRRKLGI